jgi:hypothetical protein
MLRSCYGSRVREGVLVVAGMVLLGTGCGSPDDGGAGGTAGLPEAASPAVTSSASSSAAGPATEAATTGTSRGGAPGSAPGPCDVLSGTEVAAAVGGSGADGVQVQHACVYPGADGPMRLMVSLVAAGDPAEELMSAPGFERVDGLGERAGWAPDLKTLMVLSHDRLLGLMSTGEDLDEAAARSALEGLARRSLDRW